MILTEELEKTLKRAVQTAKSKRHEFVTLEHLLYALTEDEWAREILTQCGANLGDLRQDIESYFAKHLPPLTDSSDPQYTLGVTLTLQFAAAQIQSSGKDRMDGGHVLAALFREHQSHAVYFLKKQNISRLDILQYLSHQISKWPQLPETEKHLPDKPGEKKQPDPLLRFCVNLNEKAKKGAIDPLIGRAMELDRTVHILSRRRKNNPIFVGDAGVGKTAIAEGLALAITEGRLARNLSKSVIYKLDMASLLAGTKFRGEFEERLKQVVSRLTSDPNAILFIDEIHTLIGAGSVSGGSMDASNLLKPALAHGEIRCMGTTTYKEYREIFEKDPALSRRFQKIEVNEPSVEETFQILKGLKKHYESFHNVSYSLRALKACAELSAKCIPGRFLPDKAIDVMDESGAELKLKNEGNQSRSRVGIREIESVVARIAKVPTQTVHADDKKRLGTLAPDLKLLIYGQNAAIEQVVRSILLSRSGLSEPDKPIGSFLFAGPTGVGKTEVAKQLAKLMGIDFLRFDMSEYMEKHTVSRLIGSPPGYVGFDQGGLLTEAVHKSPHCVLLLDEIEKAHEDLFALLLQVMDHATLTDNNGRKIDFRQVIVILTTNTGARESQAKPIGFEKGHYEDRSLKAIEKTFSPEFRNRLTAIVPFAPLNLELAEQIVDKMIAELEVRLKDKRVELILEPSARRYLAEKGFDPQYGARPIKRLIENEIAQKLSEEVLFGRLTNGGKAIFLLPPEQTELTLQVET